MSLIDLLATAAELPDAWRSTVVGRFGGANFKLLRMDAGAYEEETHDFAEGLLVLDGAMRLSVGGAIIDVGAGQLYVVPAGVAHAVAPGSRGTLAILDV